MGGVGVLALVVGEDDVARRVPQMGRRLRLRQDLVLLRLLVQLRQPLVLRQLLVLVLRWPVAVGENPGLAKEALGQRRSFVLGKILA